MADAVPLGTTTATVSVEPARLRVAAPLGSSGMSTLARSRESSRSRLAVRRACPGAPGVSAPDASRLGRPALLLAFSLAAVGAGTARALTTTYLPVLLERIDDAPSLIGAVMTVNAVVRPAWCPLVVGVWSDRREATGLGRRLPFMAGGAVLAARRPARGRARQRQLLPRARRSPPRSSTPASTR